MYKRSLTRGERRLAILCGTCAWADHEKFYPQSVKPTDRLEYYARFFPIVEVDSSYYAIPAARTVQEWVNRTPNQFRFDVKVYKSLTRHTKQNQEIAVEEDVVKMHEAIRPLRESGKLGAVLFQFPPWFVFREENAEYLKKVRDWFHDDLVAIEFRHRSWWMDGERTEDTLRWLRDHEFVNVVCDEPQVGMGTIPLIPNVTNPSCVVFRLHGRNERMWYEKGLKSSSQRFNYKYSVAELTQLSSYVQQWAKASADVHVLMNNNQGDYAVTNAFDWLSILDLGVRERPRQRGVQGRLF